MVFLKLVRAEWTKTMRMLSTYIAFIAAGLLVMLLHLGMYFAAPKSEAYDFFNKNDLNISMVVNGFVTTRMTLEVGFILLVAPMVIQIFARQVAGEDLRGTLRLILSRPISRLALLNAKFIVCFSYCVLLMGFLLSMGYGVGLGLYGKNDSMTIGSFREFNGRRFSNDVQTQYKAEAATIKESQGEEALKDPADQKDLKKKISNRLLIQNYGLKAQDCIPRLLLAWILTTLALMTIGSLAFFFSVVNKHPIAAMAATLGTFFLVKIMQELASAENIIPLFKAMQPYLFTTAMDDFWRGAFSHEIKWDVLREKGRLLLVYTVVFYGLAQFIFWRKDITS